MHAIEVSATGGPEVLAYVERPVPEPAPGQLLIKTEAIGVNFVDTYFRTGLYPHALPFILGSEVAGTVAAVGEGVHTAHVGDRVATSDADGAYAEYCLAPADLVCHVPDGVSAELRPHFLRSYDEFAWRTDELFAAVQAGTMTVTTGDRYPLRNAAQAHRDLEGRKTHGSTVLIP
jgi:NADPH:quinone reductase-like Zn-dependent oxidoreductase